MAVHEGGFPACHYLCKAGRELHALSVADTCLRWNVAFLPKVISRTHLNQPIQLARFDSPSEEGRSELLCPVRALKAYIAATASIRQSESIVCVSRWP